MVQVEEAAEPVFDTSGASFIDVRRDPMILRLAQGDDARVRRLRAPDGFAPERVGTAPEGALSLLEDRLIVAEKQLITKLPSSRSDFAFFNARRSAGLEAQGAAAETADAPAPAGEGELIRVEEDGSWGELISDDGGASGPQAAVYVETEIENTTSGVLGLRESQRFALYEDTIVVLQTARALGEVLTSNGFSTRDAAQVVQAATRLHATPETLEAGSIVALRMKPDVTGARLLQMSLYGPDGYLNSLAQVGAGRFAPSADPWIEANLLERSGSLRAEAATPKEVRLLDALYSAAIRNGLPTSLVGEVIVAMSRSYDLDRFAAQGDRVTLLYATEEDVADHGLARALYVEIDGPSGEMPCYVTLIDAETGYGCFDFDKGIAGGAVAGGLSGGLIVPVAGTKTSGFGPRHHPILKQVRNHNGLDWAAPTGTPIKAAAAGKVTYAGVAGGYGNVVYIDHGNGLETRYAHMSKFAPAGRAGQRVEGGEVIGFVGTTGRSTGPHLHFEVRLNGTPVDPLTFGGTPGTATVSTGGTPGSTAVESLVNQIIKVESGGKANAKNPRSTATGLGQFIQSTWLRMMRDYRPDLYRSMSRAELLALRNDPALSREMVRNLARENEAFLRSRGHQITPGRLYLAHFLGPGGAHTSLSSSPGSTVLQVMGASVVNANPFLRGKTNGDMWAWSDRKMRGAGSGGASVAVYTAPKAQRVIPPEAKAYRKQIDEILAEV